MTTNGFAQIVVFLAVLLGLAVPLGSYIARALEDERHWARRFFEPFERRLFRLGGIQPSEEMSWQRYASAMLIFNAAGLVAVYLLQRLQAALPLNPLGLPAVSPDLAFNTAVSFATNTNWQAYSGETTLSHLVQMLGLTVQNFVSAASGIAVLLALVRGLVRRSSETIGNFWGDLTRSTFLVLLPLSSFLAIFLVSQGVVQTWAGHVKVTAVDEISTAESSASGGSATTQTLALGPVASQIAIKQLGTNGGGFYNVNSAHPYENPSPLSNLAELLSILLLPAALCLTFGQLISDPRQGRALLAAMTVVFVVFLGVSVYAEQAANPVLGRVGVDMQAGLSQSGGNMEGKEVRFGITGSALWATATSAASNGSVNAMHDSFMPLGGLVPLILIQLGEVIFGGVGSGLYGMLMFVFVAVFVGGLMVGRTPEYLGKKIEAFEMKMASLVILLPALATLFGTAFAAVVPAGARAVSNPGPHGFTEILYAFSSAANNNGSAFAGLSANSAFYNMALGVCMLVGRYWVAIAVLAAAGSLAKKKTVAAGLGTLPTHTPLFTALLVGTITLVGALTFVPAFALGPVAEHLLLR